MARAGGGARGVLGWRKQGGGPGAGRCVGGYGEFFGELFFFFPPRGRGGWADEFVGGGDIGFYGE